MIDITAQNYICMTNFYIRSSEKLLESLTGKFGNLVKPLIEILLKLETFASTVKNKFSINKRHI